jgi:enoyl-CoA hydratase/carnithine racemase
MTYEHIELHVGPRFARLTLNRPDRRNALSLALMREMLGALDEIADSPSPVLVIDAGPAFSAGPDLNEIVATVREAFYEGRSPPVSS